jgi:hypothetical protein
MPATEVLTPKMQCLWSGLVVQLIVILISKFYVPGDGNRTLLVSFNFELHVLKYKY